MKVQLIVVQGKPEGKVIPLTLPVFRIGRGETCHLRPSSEQVSREHAEFQVVGEQVTVRDLGSRNGTLVNGKALTAPCTLKDRDLVQVGPLTFAVAIEGAAVPEAKAVAPAKLASPDDVSHDQIDSWLVSDANNPVPDRPSGVYRGETVTMNAFKQGNGSAKAAAPAPAAPAPAATAPAPAPAKPAAAAAAKPVAVAAAAKPAEAPPAPKPVAPAAAVPAPAKAVAAKPAAPPPMPEVEIEVEYERLPEGEGDADEERDEMEGEGGENEGSEQAPQDFIDESNPFFVKKKEPEGPSKPVYKDTSDAASDILKKMLERRKSSK